MRFLNNLPIAVKTLLAPVVSALILIAIVAQFVFSYFENREALSFLQRASAIGQAVHLATQEFDNAYTALFRSVSWKVASVDAQTVKRSSDQARNGLTQAAERLKAIDSSGLPEVEKRVSDLLVALEDYRNKAVETLDLAELDGFIATMSLNDDEDGAAAVQTRMQELIQYAGQLENNALQRAQTSVDYGFTSLLTGAGISVPVSLLIAWFFARLVANPVRRLTGVMTGLAEGRTELDIPGNQRTDEIGSMSRAVLYFKEQLLDKVRLEAEREAAAAEEDTRRREMMHAMARQLDGSVGDVIRSLTASTGALSATASNLSSVTSSTAKTVENVASAASDTDSNVHSVASAAEELSASINEIGAQAHRSVNVSHSAVGEIENAENAVQSLSEAAAQISAVTDLISSIAAQTNLLALNATIEAARASSAGRGFAVVATEVKTLASRTAQATKQISDRIEAIRSATDRSVTAIRGIKATISEVNDIASSISAAVTEQGAATVEISRNMQLVARSSQSVSDEIGGVKRGAATTGEAATEVAAAVDQLRDQTARMEDKVRSFIREIQAA
jgi:methyl-accepting chemotaxis protein